MHYTGYSLIQSINPVLLPSHKENASEALEIMKGVNDFGTIEAGKRADLILVSSNPLMDVNNIKKIIGVMAAGNWYSKDKLDQLIGNK